MPDIAYLPPFDLGLSLRAVRSFGQPTTPPSAVAAEILRLGVRVAGRPTLLEARQVSFDPPLLRAVSRPHAPTRLVCPLVERVVNAALDLRPFYRLVASHGTLGPITQELHGLKPFRPASMLDMLVSAIVEQQISLAAAHHVHDRLVRRFGDEIEGVPLFPPAEALAEAPLEALTDCGLSRRKAEYVSGVAWAVTEGALDLEELETASVDEVRERLTSLHGFGPWSADYVLIRGLGRADVVPADDLGVRTVLGLMLSDGHRLSPAEVAEYLAPFAPYRGLATFYLLVASRLLPAVQPMTATNAAAFSQ